jgi:hypothetical protein
LFSRNLASLDDKSELVRETYTLRENRPTIIREKLDEPDEDDRKSPRQMEDWWKNANHRDIQMRSVIDYNLWNAAKWYGTFYASYGPQKPSIIGLIFTNREAARSIFERWRERFGEVDRNDEIYLSIVRGVSDENPHHYNVLIASKPDLSNAGKVNRAMVLSRFNRMQPDTGTNLRNFLAEYQKIGSYLLMPAVLNDGKPELLSDVAILKRNLIVKLARDVGPHEIEQTCLGDAIDTHFADTDVAPSSSLP